MTDIRTPDTATSESRRRPTPGPAVLLLVGIALLYLVLGVGFYLVVGEAGIFLTQIFALLIPSLLFLRLGGFPITETLSLRAPTARGLVGGVLLMAGGLPIAWVLSWLQGFFIEVPVELLESLTDLLVTDDPVRMVWLVLLVAVTPAICEEVLFRGVLLESFRSRWSVPVAVVLSGVVFGLFHLSPQTVFRFLPTAWLGVLLAWTVVETRSLWTSVILHFLNNGTILALTLIPSTREMASDVDQDPPWLLLPLAIVAFVAGIRILRSVGRSE